MTRGGGQGWAKRGGGEEGGGRGIENSNEKKVVKWKKILKKAFQKVYFSDQACTGNMRAKRIPDFC